MEEMFVDIGLCKEEAERLVSPGDRITMHAPLEEMYGGLVCGKALDDRAGVAAILYALELLGEEDPGINVAVQFTAKEETGGQGAVIGAYAAQADYARRGRGQMRDAQKGRDDRLFPGARQADVGRDAPPCGGAGHPVPA